MASIHNEALPAIEEYHTFRLSAYYPDRVGKILYFEGVGDADVYNTSLPFFTEGQWVIAARVESRNSERSKTMFFNQDKKDLNRWRLLSEAPILPLQDPFVIEINSEIVLGGVSACWDNNDRLITYNTHFYKGKSIMGWSKSCIQSE
jgi:hypothetical protein